MEASQPGVSIQPSTGLLELDPSRTAVIVVDMQDDLVAASGAFARAGRDISSIQNIIPSHCSRVERGTDGRNEGCLFKDGISTGPVRCRLASLEKLGGNVRRRNRRDEYRAGWKPEPDIHSGYVEH